MFWKIDESLTEDEDEDNLDHEVADHRVFARAYTVFNSAQVDGYTPPEPPVLADGETDRSRRTGFVPISGSRSAMAVTGSSTRPPGDFVQMPDFKRIRDGIS